MIECKVLCKGLERTIREGLLRTAQYMDHCECETGHLAIFARSEGKRWEEKHFRRDESLRRRTIIVWGM